MKKNSIRKNILLRNMYKFILLPIIPLIIIGLIFISTTQYYIKKAIDENSKGQLKIAIEYINVILSDVKAINNAFDNNVSLSIAIKRSLRDSSLSYEDRSSFRMFHTTLLSQLYSKPYIHSLYLYYKNENNKFISSNRNEIPTFDSFYDTQWVDRYSEAPDALDYWSELRYIKNYAFENETTSVLSIYNRLYSTGMAKSDGVVVMNLNTTYLEGILGQFALSDQNIFVLNERNEIILRHNPDYLEKQQIQSMAYYSDDSFTVKLNGENYSVSKISAYEPDWKFFLLAPSSVQYSVSNILLFFMIAVLVLLLIMQFFVTFRLTKKNYATVSNIIEILESAEKGGTFPHIHRKDDEYDYIIQNILRTFIEHSYYKTQLSERRYRTQVLELIALQGQTNPHFLFNALHTVSWKAIALTKGPNDVSHMIDNIASILEYSLRKPVHTVTVDDEVQNSISYVSIMNVRHDHKFDVRWEYDIDLKRYRIIKLSIQPLIENSIQHGFASKNDNCKIKVKIFEQNNYLKIILTDNGAGIPRDTLTEIRNKLSSDEFSEARSEHLGLFNTNKRLQLVYGKDATFKILSKYNLGTSIRISIPIEKTKILDLDTDSD